MFAEIRIELRKSVVQQLLGVSAILIGETSFAGTPGVERQQLLVSLQPAIPFALCGRFPAINFRPGTVNIRFDRNDMDG